MFSFAVMAMADTEEEIAEVIDEPLAPQSSDTVTAAQYDEIIEDEDTPESGPPDVEIPDEQLPQTGGIPAEVFYVIGGVCILSAILLLGRKSKAAEK